MHRGRLVAEGADDLARRPLTAVLVLDGDGTAHLILAVRDDAERHELQCRISRWAHRLLVEELCQEIGR